MITIYTLAFNEELQIQFLIDFYRKRFPSCNIVLYDNMSNDDTVKIAKQNNCQIIYYDTNNQINDKKYLDIKNNCWKNSTTDWVLICDMDELLDINFSQLKNEEQLKSTIIKSEGYNMINMENNCNLYGINHGVRCKPYDKSYLFNTKFIKEINYEAGCHKANPIGNVIYSENAYKAYHFNFINLDLSYQKYQLYGTRLSQENIKNGWGNHYLNSKEKIEKEFLELRKNAIKLF